MTILFFDDIPDELERIGKILNSDSRLNIEFAAPPPNLAIDTPRDGIDLYLVDHELTRAQADGSQAAYMGPTLVAHLRQNIVDRPIVLLARPQYFSQGEDLLEQLRDTADELLYKDAITDSPTSTIDMLHGLVEGYHKLSDTDLSQTDVVRLLEPPESVSATLSDAGMPRSGSSPFVYAMWVRNILMTYPGVLYNELHAATRLGLSLESFRSPEITELFMPARYTGIFNEGADLWWRQELIGIAQDLLLKNDVTGPVISTFRQAINDERSLTLEASVCVYSSESPADTVCEILRKPVKTEYSLQYRPDTRPDYCEHARVSWTAIRETNDVNFEAFSTDDQMIASELIQE